jgi:septum formation protein
LRKAGFDFEVVPSEAPEILHEGLTATELSQINAFRKAKAVANKLPGAIVLGADTLVFLDDVVLGKPANLSEAYAMLGRLQGRTHHVVTGICLLLLGQRRRKVFSVHTAVTFRPLGAVEITNYLAQINPLDKAGAYAIQEHGDWIVAGIEGSYTNVVGLPLEALLAELSAWAKPSGLKAQLPRFYP